MGNTPSVGSPQITRFLAGCPHIPPTPPESDVLAAFQDLLVAKAVPAVVAAELSTFESLDTKWMSTLPPESVAQDWLEPRECVLQVCSVQQLDDSVHELFCAIRINILLRSSEWVDKFVAADGVTALVALIHGVAKKANPAVHGEVLNVLFALASSEDAVVELAEANGCCTGLLAMLEPAAPRSLQIRALKLLAFMCSHSPSAQDIVLHAIVSTAAPGERRFRSICELFATTGDDVALQLAVVSFLNVLLTSITSAAHRVAIRDDLVYHGLLASLNASRLRAATTQPLSPGRAPGCAALVDEIGRFLDQHRVDVQGGDSMNSSLHETAMSTAPIAPEVPLEAAERVVTAPQTSASAHHDGDIVTHESAQLESRADDSIDVDNSANSAQSASSHSDSGASLPLVNGTALDVSVIQPSLDEVSRSEADGTVETSDASGVPFAAESTPTPNDRTDSAAIGLPTQPLPQHAPQQLQELQQPQQHPAAQQTQESQQPQRQPDPQETPAPHEQQDAQAVQMIQAPPALLMQHEPTMLHSLLSQLDSKTLDATTRDKITRVLQALVTSLSPESGTLRTEVVDKLERSLFAPSSQPEQPQQQAEGNARTDAFVVAPRSAQRTRMRLPDLGEAAAPAVTSPSSRSSVSKAVSLFQSFENFFSGSPMSSPTKTTTTTTTSESTDDDKKSAGNSPVDGNKVVDTDSDVRKSSLPKLTLPFFHSFRKGPGLGATPASTPIVSASVRKEGKRHSFAELAASSSCSSPLQSAKAESRRTSFVSATVDSNATSEADEVPMTLSLPSRIAKPVSSAGAAAATSASAADAAPASTAAAVADIHKFRKLLSMGAPLAAVKTKMMQAGIDPALLDQKVGFAEPVASVATLPPAPPVNVQSVAATEEAAPTQGDDIAKFRKLLSMGAPLAAVKAKMMQAGVDPALLDGPVAVVAPVAPPATTQVLVKDDPAYAKFFKLLSMGAPGPGVKSKMQMAGLNPDLLDTPNAVLPSKDEAPPAAAASAAVSAATTQVLVKDDPAYAKFFKLLSMGAPAPGVKAKMQMAGLKPELLDMPDAVLAGPEETANSEAPPQVLVKDDPEYAKFFKLLSMGAPAPGVKAKMQMAGLKPELLDTPDAVLNPPQAATESKLQVLVKDDPEYAKFFKLLTMGAPAPGVKAKMQMAGLKPELLDTPDAVLTPATAASAPVAAKPAAAPGRRAHLAIAIKPPVKPTTRSFYWQQLKGDTIKGTIWEEIEQETLGTQNNEAPLILTESELAVLENEFPPPQTTGPSTGTRGRTNSVDQGASGPMSPLASPRVVFLIDRGRANNVSIIIKQFRISNAALREAVMKLDATVLTIERVQGLLKIMPTEEEIAAITGFQGDPLTLNEAERILKDLITVPRLKQRLSALQAKLQFPTLVRDLQVKITKLRTASFELAQSAEFRTTLSVVLQVGNKMNKGTNRGDAKGFRLSDLTKLAQLKSTDRAVTLLHFVARILRQKKGNLVRLSDSLASLYDVQNIPIPELQGDMNKITEVTDNVGNELMAQKLKNSIEAKETCDQFVFVMDEFMGTASVTTSMLKAELDGTMQLIKDTMTRFDKDTDADEPAADSGPPSAASMASACEFFATVYEFSVALGKADRENDLRRLKEERQLKLQQQKAQMPARTQSSTNLLSGLSGRGLGAKADETAGPETPGKQLVRNDSASANAGMSPVMRTMSMSAIVDLKPLILELESPSKLAATNASPAPSVGIASPAPTSTLVKKPTKASDSAAAAATTDKSKLKKSADVVSPSSLSKPPHPTSRASAAAKRDDATTTTTNSSSSSAAKVSRVVTAAAKDKPKSKAKTMMAVPGKIIKATKQKSNAISPLKMLQTATGSSRFSDAADASAGVQPPAKKLLSTSADKTKRRATTTERIVPFDDGVSSLEDIRNKLERKHSAASSASSSHRASASASVTTSAKPEATESETDLLLEGNNNSSSSPPRSPEKPDVTRAAATAPAVVQS